jgi:glycosyltransferase involved in cell wall biosynthesis
MTQRTPGGASALPGEIVLLAGKDPLAEIGGGHSAYVRVHARAALRAGLTPHLFCASDRTEIVEAEFGIVHRIQSAIPFRLEAGMGSSRYLPLSIVHNRQIATEVARFLVGRRGPHLIHGFGVWAEAGLRVRAKLRRRSVPVVTIASAYTTNRHESRARLRGLIHGHGLWRTVKFGAEYLWIRTVVDRSERRALTQSDLVLINYESVRRLLPAWRRDLARRLPYTSESAFRNDVPQVPPVLSEAVGRLVSRDAPLLVAVSRHDPRKGIDVLLEALARLRRKGVAFRACLVGGGTLMQAHRRLAEQLALSDVISIEGCVDDVHPYLSSADVYVLPSREEGSGSLALIEALQAGCAVVASDCDGIPEDLQDGDNAILVPPDNSEALATALDRVLRDASLRRSLSRRARETFDSRFSAARFTEALARTYAELAQAALRRG